MGAADQRQKDLVLEQPDGTAVIGELVSIYMKELRAGPPPDPACFVWTLCPEEVCPPLLKVNLFS